MHYNIDQIKKDVIGKWLGIYQQLGIEVPADPKKHGACPLCGPGNNAHRFRCDNNEGTGRWICSQCGSGDGWSLVMLKYGWSFMDAVRNIAPIIGSVEFVPSPSEEDESKKREFMNKIWKDSGPLTGGDLVTKYLRSRGIVIQPDTTQVRLNPFCHESETNTQMPAMVCMVRDVSGKPIGLHRTYLTDKAEKADLKSPRKAIGKTARGSIRLMPATDTVGVAEGVESALSAAQLFDMPVWAVVNAGGMESFHPPEGVRKIVIFADNDATFTGQKAAYNLANRLYLKDFIVDDPQIPVIRGDDWNDVLMKNREKQKE
jgi:putative DNA primase/helicase